MRLFAWLALAVIACLIWNPAMSLAQSKADSTAKAEHGMIGVGKETASDHTTHSDAQWFPDASFGLFIHWGVASVRASNISWPMIPGRALAKDKIDDPAEQQRIVREGDWNLNGKPNSITPNEYWAAAKDFNPQSYDPDKWLRAAKEAGFTYAVLTTRHHEGFALWPSTYGDFNTKNYMGGRDLVKDYVEACRKNGLKVGLYYSPPDWHFDREYMSFLYHGAKKTNPWVPSLDADLKVRTTQHSEEETKAHQAAYADYVNGQIEELLTRYGKIDLMWFDGKPAVGDNKVISIQRIRQLQPGIVINPRLHGHGDFVTFERRMNIDKPVTGWAEFCNTWTSSWSHQDLPFRSNGFVLGQLATARSLGVNYLLGVGPMSNGEMCDDVYKNMAVVAEWMKANGSSVHAAKPLPSGESSNVPATSMAQTRYIFAIPKYKDNSMRDEDMLAMTDEKLTLKGVATKPESVKLMGDGSDLHFDYVDNTVTIDLPAAKRTKLADVVQVQLPAQ